LKGGDGVEQTTYDLLKEGTKKVDVCWMARTCDELSAYLPGIETLVTCGYCVYVMFPSPEEACSWLSEASPQLTELVDDGHRLYCGNIAEQIATIGRMKAPVVIDGRWLTFKYLEGTKLSAAVLYLRAQCCAEFGLCLQYAQEGHRVAIRTSFARNCEDVCIYVAEANSSLGWP